MVTYKEVLQLEYDKKQTQFAIDGILIINKKLQDEHIPLIALINEKNIWICPFCLNESNKFVIENKGLIKCPNCSNYMKMKTLLFVKDCSNEEYARWVYEYRLSGFFKKINFEQWTKKLKELGMSYEFWEKYKQLKGEDIEYDKKPVFTHEQNEIIINLFVQKIKEGLDRTKIIRDLDSKDIDFDVEHFDYFFNEAELRIKRNGV